MTLRDTTIDIRRRQLAVYRAMEPSRRVDLAAAMSEELRQVALAGIRSRNPGFDSAQIHREWLRLLHGDELAARVAARP